MTPPTKGEQTRRRILETASTLFSQKSFDAVSMRVIAKEAGVDPALISHYFGSKEGLFEAMLEQSVGVDAIAAEMFSGDVTGLGATMVRVAEQLWASEAGKGVIAIMRRAFADDSQLVRQFATKALLGRLVERLPNDEDGMLRASLVATQMSGLLFARHVLRIEPLASLTADQVVALIGPAVQHYLTGELSDRR
uniref:TetR/AcrR family transcriptional regulator n=1 Tax=Tessaracoccus timonensis TaxID=2161816 RepID=UPI000D557207|nr:TetR family transcriptional regulator [Tessaracoccus timonensis]